MLARLACVVERETIAGTDLIRQDTLVVAGGAGERNGWRRASTSKGGVAETWRQRARALSPGLDEIFVGRRPEKRSCEADRPLIIRGRRNRGYLPLKRYVPPASRETPGPSLKGGTVFLISTRVGDSHVLCGPKSAK